jgi:prepilin-type N-terminal cleavage/methylation domain-containing protein
MDLKNRRSGFTLVEMVLALVILGVVAAIAIPKFLDVRREARQASVEALGAAIQAADAHIYVAAAAKGLSALSYSSYPTGSMSPTGTSNVRLWCGHPDVQWDGIGNAVLGANVVWGTGYHRPTQYRFGDFMFSKSTEAGIQKAIWQLTTASNPSNCKVEYLYTPGSNPCPAIPVTPTVRRTVSGC